MQGITARQILPEPPSKENTVTDMLDIAGLDKAELLVALFVNAAPPSGIAVFAPDAGEMLTVEGARQIFAGYTSANPYAGQPYYVDYVHGRKLHINLQYDTTDATEYDRANGAGKAAQVVAELRNGQKTAVSDLLANPEFVRLQALAAQAEAAQAAAATSDSDASASSADDDGHECPRTVACTSTSSSVFACPSTER